MKRKKSDRQKTERTCVVCRKPFQKSELVRINIKKDTDIFVFDNSNDGRGVYFCKDDACLSKISKHNKYKDAYLQYTLSK